MHFLMEIPEKFLPAVTRGEVARSGCILKNVASGRIVGHLKQVGDLAPQLMQALGPLQLTSGVGAVASIAGLGVSVAGFALVLRRLGQLEHNLNEALGRLKAEVERVQLTLDLLNMAELRSAWEQLQGAGWAALEWRSRGLL